MTRIAEVRAGVVLEWHLRLYAPICGCRLFKVHRGAHWGGLRNILHLQHPWPMQTRGRLCVLERMDRTRLCYCEVHDGI